MHFLVISLLSILAGILLLAKFRKEQIGKFFAYVSWFFIVVGFMLFIGFIAGGIVRMSHRHMMGHPQWRHEMMMKGWHHRMFDGRTRPGPMNGMWHDSLMKSCCKYPVGDTAKMPPHKPK